jgi:chromosomal replication initiation ATPase DnaA
MDDSRILGDDSFTDRVLGQAGDRPKRHLRLEEIITAVCRNYAIEENEIATPGKYRKLSEARGMAAWLILETGYGSISALGSLTGRDVTTLSAVAKHLQERAKKDSGLSERMMELKKELGLIALMQAPLFWTPLF